jgi:hypothetical protein
MGSGQADAYDDDIRLNDSHKNKIFTKRKSVLDYQELEGKLAKLYMSLEDQQLKQETWQFLDELRECITRGTSQDSKLYLKIGYVFHAV